MPEEKQSTEKEIKLIEGCISGEKTTENEFDDRFRPIIFSIVMKFAKNKEEAEDLTQEILWKCFVKMKESKPTQNLRAWVLTVAKNYCRDKFREKESKDAKEFIRTKTKYDKTKDHIYEYEDHKAIAPGSKEYYKEDNEYINIDTLYKRTIPYQKRRDNIEVSIKLVEIYYKLKDKIKSDPTKYESISKIKKILFDTQKKIKGVVGYMPKEKIERYDDLRATPDEYRSDSDKKELERLNKKEFLIAIHRALNEFLRRIYMPVYDIVFYDLLSTASGKPCPSRGFTADYYLFVLCDLVLKSKSMKIKPPRLLYCIWKKAVCFDKGKYTNQDKMKLVFSYFKRKTKGTEQEFLFDSIDENLSTFESIRKSFYKKSTNLEPNNEIVDFIYKSSFKPEKVQDLFPGVFIKLLS